MLPARYDDMNNGQLSPSYKAYSFSIISLLGSANQDFLISDRSVLTRMQAFFTGIAVGDNMKIQIIDKDNVTGHGANYVIATLVEKYFIVVSVKEDIDFGYPVEIPAGCYFRLVFASTNILSVIAGRVNLQTHTVLVES